MRIKFVGVLLYLFAALPLSAQGNVKEEASYEELIEQIELYQGSPKVWVYLNRYLAKAKAEHNGLEMVSAYKEMMHECEPGQRLVYADSMILAAHKSGVNDLIGSSYLSKGVVYYQMKQHNLALDNYLLANRYIVGTDDKYLVYKVKYSIAQIKYYLGYYHEAISLLGDCIEFYRDREPLPYLYSLHSIALCYVYTDDLEKARQANAFSLEESRRLDSKVILPYIEMAEGIANYKGADYKSAVHSLAFALPPIAKNGDFANEAVTNFYLGKSYWASGSHQKAIRHFMSVDEAFAKHGYIRPDLRQAYEFLIPHFQKKGQPDIELKYIKRLLSADSVLNTQFSYLVKKVHKEYDTKELLDEKKKIESDLQKTRNFSWVFKSLVLVMAAVLFYLFRRHRLLRKQYKEKFEALLKNDVHAPQPVNHVNTEGLDINPDIVQNILSQVEGFERKHGFLKKDINAGKLAEAFGTNYKYLSKVIRYYRQKSFVNYINDLRIDYLVERLKAEPMLRKYTNGALASESGFSTAQHFTTAFKKRTGISPGYFVEEFEKLESEKT